MAALLTPHGSEEIKSFWEQSAEICSLPVLSFLRRFAVLDKPTFSRCPPWLRSNFLFQRRRRRWAWQGKLLEGFNITKLSNKNNKREKKKFPCQLRAKGPKSLWKSIVGLFFFFCLLFAHWPSPSLKWNKLKLSEVGGGGMWNLPSPLQVLPWLLAPSSFNSSSLWSVYAPRMKVRTCL